VRAKIVDSTGAEKGFVLIDGQAITVKTETFDAPCSWKYENNTVPIVKNNTFPTGMNWHIHEKWDHPAGTDSGFGFEQCGAAFTGGHYDPTYACGPASQHQGGKCSPSPGCVSPSSASIDGNERQEYRCDPSPTGYRAEPFRCEAGDLSGKYGTHDLGAPEQTYTDPYMPNANRLVNRSIVFHCATGRIFCGKLVAEEQAVGAITAAEKPADSVTTLTAMFHPTVGSRASIGSFVLTKDTIDANIDLSKLTTESITTALASACEGDTLQWHIHEKWLRGEGQVAALGADACSENYTSNHYDPLLACSVFSHNDLCATKVGGCVTPSSSISATQANYQCNFTEFPFSCEVGDLSAKYGDYKIAVDGTGSFSRTGTMDFLPPLSTLAGKSIVYHCGGKRSFCAELMPTPPHDVVQATFQYSNGTKSRAVGFVVLDGPEASIELDLGAVANGAAFIADNCPDGIKYHIHDTWNPTGAGDTSYVDIIGESCNTNTVIKGHYDPGLACSDVSAESGNCALIKQSTDSCPAKPASSYACSAAEYASNPFACEVGDLSGKFGTVIVDPTTLKVSRNDNDAFYEHTTALAGRSIALHCGTQIFACAKLEVKASTRVKPTTTEVTPPAEGNNGVVATLPNGVGAVKIQSSTIFVDVDLSKLSDEDRTNADLAACYSGGASTPLTWHIHDLWTDGGSTSGLGSTSCGASATGGHYDPTWACGPASSGRSSACDDAGKYCSQSAAAYNCNSSVAAGTNRFACEVGDMSGRYGGLPLTSGKGVFSLNREDNLLPPFAVLAGKSIVFHCNGQRAMCAKLIATRIEASPTPAPEIPGLSPSADDGGKAGTGLDVASLIVSLVFFAVFELTLMIVSIIVCFNCFSCCYCSSSHRVVGIVYFVLQLTAICCAGFVFVLGLSSECHGETRCVLLITNSALQAVVGIVTVMAHFILWLPSMLKHRRFVSVLAVVDLFLSFIGGISSVVGASAHPDGHTATYTTAVVFAFIEWFTISAAALLGSVSFDIAAMQKKRLDGDKAVDSSKINVAMTTLSESATQGGGVVEGAVTDFVSTYVAIHDFEPQNTPDDPDLEIKLTKGDTVEVLKRSLDESTDWWKVRNIRTGEIGYCPENHLAKSSQETTTNEAAVAVVGSAVLEERVPATTTSLPAVEDDDAEVPAETTTGPTEL
jgi:hypothetical protein